MWVHIYYLSKRHLCFSAANEPPTEKTGEAPDDDDDDNRDACDGARAETTSIGISSAGTASIDIADDRSLTIRWRSTAYAISDTGNLAVISIASCAAIPRFIVSRETL